MSIKSFSDYIVESSKEVTFVFGRFNPPTEGHEKLFETLKKVSRGGTYRIYTDTTGLANHTLVSATPVFTDQQFNKSIHGGTTVEGTELDILPLDSSDLPVTIQNYYLWRTNQVAGSDYPLPLFVNAADPIPVGQFIEADFPTATFRGRPITGKGANKKLGTEYRVINLLKRKGFYINNIKKDFANNDRCIISTKI